MRTCHIHIMGAAGAGVTTLGRALADALALSHHDTDDYFWLPTNPAFRELRPVPDRLRLMQEMFCARDGWMLSGSLDSWGDPLIPLLDFVVFLYVPTSIRLQRLREREAQHFGADAVAPGGWRHDETESFIEWASHYDDGTQEGRSLPRHEAWLARLSCPVLRLDGDRPVADLVRECCVAIERWKQSH